MKIAIASDHGGFPQKKPLKDYLEDQGHVVLDLGPSTDERCDYPDFGSKVAKMVSERAVDRGILICGSGIGMCIVANRFKGVRAAVLRSENDTILSREHNDANVACFGSRMTDFETTKKLTNLFLATQFGAGRHKIRIEKIDG